MNKFKTLEDIPEFPKYHSQEEYKHLIKEYIEAGAIPKSDLIVGAYYLGICRNSYIAQWTGNEFRYIRDKLGSSYIDGINHFEDDDGYDLFIPFTLVIKT